ncbi:hypothetical protein [Vibrio parahaemolyticus]|uniref:hypothetical protein n=1 Tax=Vibrio parahaemolyticus TaxID=670 RepID=UPI00215272E7|nr:hypothetical protein [Vibrio parahaemolyticus]
MASSEYQFNRWSPQAKTSWAWRVFKKHNVEFYRMYTAFDNSHKYTYKKLSADKAQWTDLPTKHFEFENQWEYEKFTDLQDWSSAFNQLENWMNLNALVAILSNLETYMATIIPLALESDVGVLFGTPNKIDGIEILKNGKESPFDFDDIVVSCTKGTWDSRLAAYKRAFGRAPKYLEGHISELDKMRNLRNNVAHSFGRDIEASRKKGEVTTLPIETLSRQRLLKYQAIVWKSAKAIDAHLHNFHIGEYQRVLFYHGLYPSLNKKVHPNQRAVELKKKIGQFGDIAAGKNFCKGLVAYYEAL